MLLLPDDDLLMEVEIPDELEPIISLQDNLRKLDCKNFDQILNSILCLTSKIDLATIIHNILKISPKRPKNTYLYTELTGIICKNKNFKINQKLSQYRCCQKEFRDFFNQDILSPDSKTDFEKNKIVISEKDKFVKYVKYDNVQKLCKRYYDYDVQSLKFNPFDHDFFNEGLLDALSLSALYGSVKCFKVFLLNGFKITEFTIKCSIIGGSYEIIHLCKDSKCACFYPFYLFYAVDFYHHEIYDWIVYHYQCNRIHLEKITETNNVLVAYKALSEEYGRYIFDDVFENLIQFSNIDVIRLIVERKYIYDIINFYNALKMAKTIEVVELLRSGLCIETDDLFKKKTYTKRMH